MLKSQAQLDFEDQHRGRKGKIVDIRSDIEAILAPAIDPRAPYAKVMIDKIYALLLPAGREPSSKRLMKYLLQVQEAYFSGPSLVPMSPCPLPDRYELRQYEYLTRLKTAVGDFSCLEDEDHDHA